MFVQRLWPLLFILVVPVFARPRVASAWYAGWHAADFPLSSVSWSKYTQMTYAFAVTSPDGTISLEESDKAFIPQFVSEAHKHNVLASVSIGGWGGSRFYSSSVDSSKNRTAFVDQILDMVSEYSLDGVDFDWEYPNRQGLGCNIINTNDTANFLAFLQELRERPAGKNLTLSAATSLKPFNDSSSTPLADVSPFADVLDYIAIMNYDVWSFWSPAVGPNAPLNDTCAQPSYRTGSAVSAVDAWASAGMPRDQIVLGVASYGHSFHVKESNALGSDALQAYPAFQTSAQAKGDRWDGDGGVDVCGVEQGPSGVFTFWGLVEEGFINANGSALDGIGYRYDDCSQTPYVYNPASEVMVSFDNAESFAAKGNFISENGLGGFAMWEAGGDYKDILLDSILSATGATASSPTSAPSETSPSSAAFSSRSRVSVLVLVLQIVFFSSLFL
ncbi:chitinase [Mucidula mucida]|nr:chitinase [Mucidula mucida]